MAVYLCTAEVFDVGEPVAAAVTVPGVAAAAVAAVVGCISGCHRQLLRHDCSLSVEHTARSRASLPWCVVL